jgi:hypothetical protein
LKNQEPKAYQEFLKIRNQEPKPEPGTEPGSSGLILGSTMIFLAIPVIFCQNQELKPEVLG